MPLPAEVRRWCRDEWKRTRQPGGWSDVHATKWKLVAQACRALGRAPIPPTRERNPGKSCVTGKKRKRGSEGGAQHPQAHLCPITLDVMVDPVMANDGHSYERRALEAWLDRHATSPITREPLESFHANVALRHAIEAASARG